MGFLRSSLRGFSVLSDLAQSLLVGGGGSAAPTLHVLLPAAKSCPGAGAVLGAQPAQPEVSAAVWAQSPRVGNPRAGLSLLCLPKPLPAACQGGAGTGQGTQTATLK